ncbi:unnamed protein product, partial [Hymenolepis diminuta]
MTVYHVDHCRNYPSHIAFTRLFVFGIHSTISFFLYYGFTILCNLLSALTLYRVPIIIFPFITLYLR